MPFRAVAVSINGRLWVNSTSVGVSFSVSNMKSRSIAPRVICR